MRIKNGNISLALWLLAGLVATPVFAKDGDSKTYGSISAKSSNSVTVQGINFTMTSSSQCERSNGSHISCSSIAIGNYVEVSWTGNYLVREIELLSTSNAQPTPSATPGHSSSNDDNGHHSNTSHSSSKSKSSKKQVKIKASFGSDSSSTIAGGRVEYRVKKSETRFLVSISIPENTSPSISSLEEAKALSITAKFSRSGTANALYTRKLDNRKPEK